MRRQQVATPGGHVGCGCAMAPVLFLGSSDLCTALSERNTAAVAVPVCLLQAGRDEAAVAKAARDEVLAAKRAKLKAAFLSQQVKALKAGKQQKQQQAKPSSSKAAPGGGGGD